MSTLKQAWDTNASSNKFYNKHFVHKNDLIKTIKEACAKHKGNINCYSKNVYIHNNDLIIKTRL